MSSNSNTRPNSIRSQESSLRNSLSVASPIESKASNSSIVCHKCHLKGNIASRCPQRTLTLGVEQSSLEDEEDQIVDPLDYSCSVHFTTNTFTFKIYSNTNTNTNAFSLP